MTSWRAPCHGGVLTRPLVGPSHRPWAIGRAGCATACRRQLRCAPCRPSPPPRRSVNRSPTHGPSNGWSPPLCSLTDLAGCWWSSRARPMSCGTLRAANPTTIPLISYKSEVLLRGSREQGRAYRKSPPGRRGRWVFEPNPTRPDDQSVAGTPRGKRRRLRGAHRADHDLLRRLPGLRSGRRRRGAVAACTRRRNPVRSPSSTCAG